MTDHQGGHPFIHQMVTERTRELTITGTSTIKIQFLFVHGVARWAQECKQYNGITMKREKIKLKKRILKPHKIPSWFHTQNK